MYKLFVAGICVCLILLLTLPIIVGIWIKNLIINTTERQGREVLKGIAEILSQTSVIGIGLGIFSDNPKGSLVGISFVLTSLLIRRIL